VLILGSFPGDASLAAAQYYAHPRNHFWPLLGSLLGVPLTAMTYPDRVAAVLDAGVGLWDTIVACRRHGSLDDAIRDAEWGSPAVARRAAPALVLACFNGRTAARAATRWRAAGLATHELPSTSPAHARPLGEKLERWRIVADTLAAYQPKGRQ
jgi:hypoxanthine-DNA glycosylase